MPITPTYPGVYVEEVPSGVRTDHGRRDLDHRVRRPRPARSGRRADLREQLRRLRAGVRRAVARSSLGYAVQRLLPERGRTRSSSGSHTTTAPTRVDDAAAASRPSRPALAASPACGAERSGSMRPVERPGERTPSTSLRRASTGDRLTLAWAAGRSSATSRSLRRSARPSPTWLRVLARAVDRDGCRRAPAAAAWTATGPWADTATPAAARRLDRAPSRPEDYTRHKTRHLRARERRPGQPPRRPAARAVGRARRLGLAPWPHDSRPAPTRGARRWTRRAASRRRRRVPTPWRPPACHGGERPYAALYFPRHPAAGPAREGPARHASPRAARSPA